MTSNQLSQNTPSSLGFHMPAEWEPHEGTWLAWPKNTVTWPQQIPKVEEIYIQIINILTRHEKVFLLVDDGVMKDTVLEKLGPLNISPVNLIIHQIKTGDAWIRDYGPNFLLKNTAPQKELAFNHWIFNAWGVKYKALVADTTVPDRITPLLNVPVFEPGIILEGGSIDVNGKGSCLTTEQCLLAKTRNPHLSREQIEQTLSDYLGVSQIIWLGKGIAGDDTDGHVDDIARFVNHNTVVCAIEDNPQDENYELLQKNHQSLISARDERGRPLNVVTLPMPEHVSFNGGRLPATYANFYIANEVVLVPIFHHANDDRALKILKDLFPKREVIGIPCADVVVGHGAIHCLTQQQPYSGGHFQPYMIKP